MSDDEVRLVANARPDVLADHRLRALAKRAVIRRRDLAGVQMSEAEGDADNEQRSCESHEITTISGTSPIASPYASQIPYPVSVIRRMGIEISHAAPSLTSLRA